MPRGLVLLLVAGAVLRIAGLWGPGHAGDIFAFITWAEDAARHGLGAYYANGGDSNYPPMLYLLWPLGLWLDGADLSFAIRSLSIPFDLALGVLMFDVVARVTGRERDGQIASAFYLLNPAVLLSGPIWGQVDGMGALPMVASIVAVARGRVDLAGALAVIAGLVKPQFGIAGFVLAGLALLWIRSPDGLRRAAILGLSALVTFVVMLAPLGLGPMSYLDLMGETFSRYPYISQFGFNPWGMVFGFGERDDAWAWLGTVLAIAGIAASLWLLRRRRDIVGLLGVSVLIGLVIYFLPTRVHERYLFGALAFLIPLAVLEPRLRWPFVALSGAVFVTVSYVAITSPYRILPGPKVNEFPDWVISLLCAVVTAIGGWTAARVVELFGIGAGARARARGRPKAEEPVRG
jgi:Gpi18-like mannosyltransferase